jgi:hypothetical protein
MRTRDKLQRAIFFRARIEMDANCDQLRQYRNSRLDEQLALLLRLPAQLGVIHPRRCRCVSGGDTGRLPVVGR